MNHQISEVFFQNQENQSPKPSVAFLKTWSSTESARIPQTEPGREVSEFWGWG
jgi:hypothetical protein